LLASDHTIPDRAYDIGAQDNGVLYEPRHGKPLTTAAFVGKATQPGPGVDAGAQFQNPKYTEGYRYNKDQCDFMAALRIFYWFKTRDEGIGSRDQTKFDINLIGEGMHDSYNNKDHIKSYSLGMIAAIKGWTVDNDEEKIGKALVRNKLYGEDMPDYIDDQNKKVRYNRHMYTWNDYQEIFGSNTPMKRCSTEQKEWDYNFEGVAHYGLLPDFLQDLTNVGLKAKDLSVMFQSAEHFAQMWVKTLNAADAIVHPQVRAIWGQGVLELQWLAEDGDQLEETGNIGDPSSWHLSPAPVRTVNRRAEATVQVDDSLAPRFFRVRKP
jgi:hypothetical protein